MKYLAICVLLAACGGDDNGGPGPNADAPHAACVEETNRYRVMDGNVTIVEDFGR